MSCKCEDNWFGELCTKSECEVKCKNGFCNSSNRCQCLKHYKGKFCQKFDEKIHKIKTTNPYNVFRICNIKSSLFNQQEIDRAALVSKSCKDLKKTLAKESLKNINNLKYNKKVLTDNKDTKFQKISNKKAIKMNSI